MMTVIAQVFIAIVGTPLLIPAGYAMPTEPWATPQECMEWQSEISNRLKLWQELQPIITVSASFVPLQRVTLSVKCWGASEGQIEQLRKNGVLVEL